MKVTVLRGISGAGKSTWIKNNAPTAFVVTTDRYFTIDGVYHFDPKNLEEFHKKCLRDFLDALQRKEPWIVVDNTNINAWEYAPYVLVARAYDYEVELLTLACTVEISLSRKDRVPSNELESISKQMEKETQSMPRQFKKMHRIINAC
jgi:predicted kinase